MSVRLAGLCALALAVRLWGIAFGLPWVYHSDEPVHVGEALGLIGGATDALSFANPPLYKYLLVALFDLVIGQERLADADNSQLYLVARAASAVLGVLTVVATYWLARQIRGQKAGLIAAGLSAVTYLLVRESHFAVNDALAALCATVALGGCVRVARHGTRSDYLAAGVVFGLAFAAKYQAAAVLAPFILAHLQRGGRRRLVDLLLGLAVALLTAVIAFPPLVTETRRVVGDVYVYLVLPSRLGWEGLDPAGAYAYYFKVLGWGVGWPTLALAGLGLGCAIVRREWSLLLVASLPLSLFTVMGASHLFFARFLLPAVPAVIVLAAILLDDLARPAPAIAAALVVVVLATTLPNSLRFDTLLTRLDTRTAARAWVQSHVPAGARVEVERVSIGPPLAQLPLDVIFPSGHTLFDLTLDDYRRQGLDYIITSSYTAEAPNLDPARDIRRREFYASLDRDAEKLAEFRPYRDTEPEFVYDRLYGPFDSLDQFEQPGPTVTVYRVTR